MGASSSPQWWHPSLEYPAIRQYLAHLLHNLKRSNYQPSLGVEHRMLPKPRDYSSHIYTKSASEIRAL